MNRIVAPALALVGALAVAATSVAAPLNLTVKYPDITTFDVTANYDADAVSSTVGRLTINATGLSMPVDVDGGLLTSSDYRINGGSANYTLTADIQHDGTLVGGSLSISGNFHKNVMFAPTEFSGLQLSGNLKEMGFAPTSGGGAKLEFRFLVTGGYLRTAHFFGNSGEIILTSTNGTFGASEFASDFQLNHVDVNTFVPTPASLTGGIVLLTGLLIGRRRALAVG